MEGISMTITDKNATDLIGTGGSDMQLDLDGRLVTLELYGRLPLLVDRIGNVVTVIGDDGLLRLPDAKTIAWLLEDRRTRIVVPGQDDAAPIPGPRPILKRVLRRDEAIDVRGAAKNAARRHRVSRREELVELAEAAMNHAATTYWSDGEPSLPAVYEGYLRAVARIRGHDGGDGIVPAGPVTFRRRVRVIGRVMQAIAPGRTSRSTAGSTTIH
jgi:hypothetical protein